MEEMLLLLGWCLVVVIVVLVLWCDNSEYRGYGGSGCVIWQEVIILILVLTGCSFSGCSDCRRYLP